MSFEGIKYKSEDGGPPIKVRDMRGSGPRSEGTTTAALLERKDTILKDPTDGRTTGNEVYEIQAIWQKHHEIIRRLALGQQSHVEIAIDLNCSPGTVSNVKNNPMVQRRMQFLQQAMDEEVVDVARRIKGVAGEAQAVLEEMMHDRAVPAIVRKSIATDQLDRAGFGAVKKMQVDKREVVCNVSFIEEQKDKVKAEQERMRAAEEVAYETVNE